MLITVPDCHPKTPKKESGNETYYFASYSTRDIYSDQLSTAEVYKAGAFENFP